MSNKTATYAKSVKKDVFSRCKFMRGTAVAGCSIVTLMAGSAKKIQMKLIKSIAAGILLALISVTQALAGESIRILTNVVGGKNVDEHALFINKVEKQIGLKVEMIKPTSNYDQVLLTTLASGEKYDLIYGTAKQLDAFISQGALMDLSGYIKESSILSDPVRIPQAEWNMIIRDGKHYSVPNKFEGGTMPTARGDWLKEFGMNAPNSLEDWYAFFKMSKEKKGAWGLSTKGLNDIQAWMSAAGLKAGYVMNVKKRTIPYASDAAAAIYDWFGKLSKEGLMDPDFPTNGSSAMRNKFLANQVSTVTYWDAWVGLFNNLRLNDDPNTKFSAIGVGAVPGPNGKTILKRGDSSIWMIPANAENPKNAIKFLEFWHSEKGYILGTLGIEGHDYTVNGGKFSMTKEGNSHGYDHGAPRVTNSSWVNPFGSLPGVLEAQAIVMAQASPEYLPKEWSTAKKIVNKYALQAMTGVISGSEAVKKMQSELSSAKLID
jgi:putative aldouronate transport system substrate-binding protein